MCTRVCNLCTCTCIRERVSILSSRNETALRVFALQCFSFMYIHVHVHAGFLLGGPLNGVPPLEKQ